MKQEPTFEQWEDLSEDNKVKLYKKGVKHFTDLRIGILIEYINELDIHIRKYSQNMTNTIWTKDGNKDHNADNLFDILWEKFVYTLNS